MTLALLNLLDEMTPFERFDSVVPALIRHLIGDDVAEMLLVPPSRLDRRPRSRPPHLRGGFSSTSCGRAERETERYRVLAKLAEPFGREMLEDAVRVGAGRRAGAVRHPRPTQAHLVVVRLMGWPQVDFSGPFVDTDLLLGAGRSSGTSAAS